MSALIETPTGYGLPWQTLIADFQVDLHRADIERDDASVSAAIVTALRASRFNLDGNVYLELVWSAIIEDVLASLGLDYDEVFPVAVD